MVTILQDAVASAAQKYVDTYGEYEFDQLQNVVAVTVDEKYLEKQKTSVALVDGYLTKLTTLEGAFNDTEMVYYQGKYLAAEHIDSELSQKVQNGIAVKNLVKWLIIGGIGFIVLWAVYYFLKYLLDPSIKTLNELEKMNRIIKRVVPEGPHETLLVVDATTGQNGVSQAIEFSKITDITGIVLTTMDGTAKGGIVLSIKDQLNIPVKFIGLGEQVDDLQEFDLEQYIYGLCKGLVEEA